MANFYTEERISINALEDIVNRPHYEASVPPRKSLFRYVLAAYSFPRKVASCSISNCYQNHKKGYLVRTAEGGECSICDSCAKRFMDPAALTPQRPPEAGPARRLQPEPDHQRLNPQSGRWSWIPLSVNVPGSRNG